jgi:hypothetical protein
LDISKASHGVDEAKIDSQALLVRIILSNPASSPEAVCVCLQSRAESISVVVVRIRFLIAGNLPHHPDKALG